MRTTTVLPGLLALAALVLAVPFTRGGKEFVASLRSAATGAHLCDATAVSPEWLVTSAHCLESREPAQLTVRISARHGSGGATLGVRERITHPDHDIALVRLSVPVSMNSAIPAAANPYRDWITHHLSKEL
ncbi:trypsin-like serine protease [Allokutzneria albata]|uniref:Trypsin n=1 Tax=Allokutzneria albata TaxID=211114 RepID=A0A1H0ADJ8_ALLAB|nr:trypsin-like serine protease [Allokutzneria albata]SDN31555.1 Trypsin [Allokutzneria albata]